MTRQAISQIKEVVCLVEELLREYDNLLVSEEREPVELFHAQTTGTKTGHQLIFAEI